ncbi:MAG: hypothetical protein V1824_01050 [archaeon]
MNSKLINYNRISIITIIFASLFFASFIYADFSVNSIVLAKEVISQGDYLDVNVTVANNESSSHRIDFNVSINFPSTKEVIVVDLNKTVSSNSTETVYYRFTSSDLNSAIALPNPYYVKAEITNDTTGDIANNTLKKYFTIKQAKKKIPVPDMPIIFGAVIGVFAIAFLLKREK